MSSSNRGETGLIGLRDKPQQKYNHFALKVISKCRLGDTAIGREALRNEVSIHRQLKHPAIVSLVAYWEDSFRIYLLMDLVAGPSLEALVTSRGRLSEQEASLYVRHILEALSYLHANRIVHRDLKLANLLLSREKRRVMLCDFGLAAHLDTLRDANTPSVCGTPNYVAPELISPSAIAAKPNRRAPKDGAKADAKGAVYTAFADLWSMGVVLYTMLVGSGPFDGEDVPKTFRRIRTARFTFPVGVRLSANAKSLIRLLLSEDVTRRPSADQALRHPFFSTHDTPKVLSWSFYSRELARESKMLENETVARDIQNAIGNNSTKSEPAHTDWADRADVRRVDDGLSKSRRLATVNRRAVEVRRWSGSYQQQTSRQVSDSVISAMGNLNVRQERLNSMQYDRSGPNFNSRVLSKATKDRSSSISTPQGIVRSQKSGKGSSLSTKTLYGMREISWSGVSTSGRRSLASLEKGNVLNLSVSLSAELLKGRKKLDERSGHTETEAARVRKFETLGKAVSANEGAPPLVRRWLDYTSKYGFATMMADGRNGCCFNDGSVMVYISETKGIPNFAYIGPNEDEGSRDSINFENTNGKREVNGSNDLSKKACLCSLFADMMMDGGRGSLYDLPSACNVSFLKSDGTEAGETVRTGTGEDYKDLVHVREWVRFRQFQAAGFRLSNGSIHVKFDIGEDGCDDFVFSGSEGWLFYRKAKQEQGWYFSITSLGDVSTQSEYLHNQLEVCAQAIARFLE